MEKIELTQFLIGKLKEREVEVAYNEGELSFVVNGVLLPDHRNHVAVNFDVGGDDFTHAVHFVIKFPANEKGGYNKVKEAVDKINSSITTGKYNIEGEGDNALLCSSYSTTFFNTKYEKMNVERTMMFMFDSLLLEYADILKNI